jgi:hypothetical protein
MGTGMSLFLVSSRNTIVDRDGSGEVGGTVAR